MPSLPLSPGLAVIPVEFFLFVSALFLYLKLLLAVHLFCWYQYHSAMSALFIALYKSTIIFDIVSIHRMLQALFWIKAGHSGGTVEFFILMVCQLFWVEPVCHCTGAGDKDSSHISRNYLPALWMGIRGRSSKPSHLSLPLLVWTPLFK